MKSALLLLVALLLGAVQPLPAHAAPRERCFGQFNTCVRDPILSYWERNGGLAGFGYPLDEVRLQTVEGRTLHVQWFERDRLEIQNDGTVTAGRLGARVLELQGRPWQSFPTVARADAGCAYFAVTQHQVCGAFLRYWQTQGGLTRFGYPIGERMSEVIEGKAYDVQYFERKRMEDHPELAGTPYAVLLGRLGPDVLLTDGCVPIDERFEPIAYAYRTALGCPGGAGRELVGNERYGLRPVPMATQTFEGGTLLWLREFSSDVLSAPRIFMITRAPDGQTLTWQSFPDEWQEGQPTGVTDSPPADRYAPVRGFGYLWAHNADVRARLGWAVAPEAGDSGGYRRFAKGFMLYRPSVDRVYLITDDGQARDLPRG